MSPRPGRFGLLLVIGCLTASACQPSEPEPVLADALPTATPAPAEPPAAVTPPDRPPPEPETAAGPDDARPPWLGTRVLPLRPDGYGEVQPTPPELADRRLPPSWTLGPGDREFSASVEPVPDEVAARSTWSAECPVALEDLRYVTVAFWGFDDRAHVGELLVHASAANDLVGVFDALFATRFPIEEMRVVAPEELDLPPTGDGNNTTAFVCRPVRGATSWSQHAYGLAVDINPFHNPYVKGDLVLPELASSYADRDEPRAGMLAAGDVATKAFASIGWGWGGDWGSLKDWMHFSASGR